MAKKLSFSNESREALEKGVNFVANAVKVTIGPKAKNVVIDRKFGSPDIVRDGLKRLRLRTLSLIWVRN